MQSSTSDTDTIHDGRITDRLTTFRDSRGLPVPRWPDVVVPSTTVILFAPIVHNHGYHVLVHCRADNGWWGFIGGAMQPGESILECARREAHEESGYEVVLDELVAIDSDPETGAINAYADNIVHYCNMTFRASVTGGTLRCSEESHALQWVSTDALPMPFLPAHLWRLHQALGKRPWVEVR